jgi:hypothetical protein
MTERPDLKQALGRLLGPGEPEIAAIPGLRAHLNGCPACREEHESLRSLVGGEQAL